MSTSELDSRNIAISMRKSVENLVISSQDAIGQSISQALTFSGVITQHANQMIQDTRNVSRSPSPSLRSADIDLLDNDKGSEMAIHVPSHPAGDSISVSSTTDITAVPLRSDNSKITSSSASVRGVEATRTKKKSWYNSLYPTYKSKSDDFKRLFKDLPDDERLIVDYSCALQKDILAHGRLYASQNYLCFYASIFGWETSLSLRWKDVTAITKEKTALVIPNAILVCTESEKNFLTSFSGRDKAYLMLFRVWQNALMDQPMSSQEIWQWVHSCYGEELGFNSDDEGYARDVALPVDAPVTLHDHSEDLVDSSSMEAGGGGESSRDDHRPARSVSHTRDSSPPLVINGEGDYRAAEAGDTLPTDMSDTSDSEQDKPHNGVDAEKCTSSHGGKLLLRQTFPFNIDQLFTMIFTNSKFNLELLAARGSTDYVQVMNKCSKPGYLYSIDASSENAGIPYADYFTVEAHYCLQRVSEHVTDFSFYGHVKYKKNMWPMVKAFLEKNAMSGLEDYGRLLDVRLAAEAECVAPAARKGRRHRRHAASQDAPTPTVVRPQPLLAARVSVSRGAARGGRGSAPWLAGALLLLVAINALLYWRLYYAGKTVVFDMDDLQDRMSSVSGSAMADWSQLLERHSVRQRGELLAWRDALERTVAHLAQTEQALKTLLETIKPSLEKAQQEAEHRTEDSRDTDTRDTLRDQAYGEL